MVDLSFVLLNMLCIYGGMAISSSLRRIIIHVRYIVFMLKADPTRAHRCAMQLNALTMLCAMIEDHTDKML